MRLIENECVACGKPCVDYCKYREVTRYYCDDCGEEKQLYAFDGEELCLDCIEKRLIKAEDVPEL